VPSRATLVNPCHAALLPQMYISSP
jgi:hypothetical protein